MAVKKLKIQEVSKKIQKKRLPSKLKTKKLPRLYLDYSERVHGGNISPGQENQSYPTCINKYIDVTFNCLLRKEPKNFFKHSVEVSPEVVNLEEVFLAVVRYSDGDSFGETFGHWHIVGILPSISLAKKAIVNAKMGKNTYKPWEGYFSSYEGGEIYRLKILDLDDDLEENSEDIKIFM